MGVTISGTTGIDMGGNPISNASQVDSIAIKENGAGVATENQVGTANSELVKTALNATGTAPIYACRAWVNFNGTGTVAIRASGNVSSITDNGVGSYAVNFTTAMPDVNYAQVCNGRYYGGVGGMVNLGGNYSTTSFNILLVNPAMTANFDNDLVTAEVFR